VFNAKSAKDAKGNLFHALFSRLVVHPMDGFAVKIIGTQSRRSGRVKRFLLAYLAFKSS
jgi:hypothetical protein